MQIYQTSKCDDRPNVEWETLSNHLASCHSQHWHHCFLSVDKVRSRWRKIVQPTKGIEGSPFKESIPAAMGSFHQAGEGRASSLNTIHEEPKHLDNSHVSCVIETEKMKAFCPLRLQLALTDTQSWVISGPEHSERSTHQHDSETKRFTHTQTYSKHHVLCHSLRTSQRAEDRSRHGVTATNERTIPNIAFSL